MAAKVLVAFATKHGSTKGIAHLVGSAVHDCGHEVRVLPASVVSSVTDYDAVVVGSAIYHDQWLWDAHRFLRRLRPQLGCRPTWLFSSGPLGGTPHGDEVVAAAVGLDTPPPATVAHLTRALDVRGHATFGGKVDPTHGLLDEWIPRGDWRDLDLVHEWGRRVGQALLAPASAASRLAQGHAAAAEVQARARRL